MTIEQAIASCEKSAERYHKAFLRNKAHGGEFYQREAESDRICEEHERQLAAWLRELAERRKAPEIVRCDECTHYIPILSNWGKCGVHCSPTEKYRTCQICDYCSWAEKREEKSKWAKNPYVQCR